MRGEERGASGSRRRAHSGARAVAWIDGGARGNPGEAGCGVLLELADGTREEHTLFIGTTTNNVAEYTALLAALERARALGIHDLDARSDSELLVRQMTGVYRVKAVHLQPLWLRASQLARTFAHFTIRHVPRTQNAAADWLANRAIDTAESTLPMPEGV